MLSVAAQYHTVWYSVAETCKILHTLRTKRHMCLFCLKNWRDRSLWEMQAALDFTPSQTQDLLQLRRLLYGTAGQLLRERQALLDRMSAAEEKAQLIMSQPVKLGFCHAMYAHNPC